MEKNKETSLTLRGRKGGQRIVAITAYDYTFARLVDELVDVVLVGDSLGMVVQGLPHTLGVTVEDVIYHSRAVSRGLRRAHLVADMPFMSYQPCEADAIRNAGRLLSEGFAEAVKLEGGVVIAPLVEKLVRYGIPVMGHIGLTPQSVHAMGGFKVQGKTEKGRHSLVDDAVALEDAGVYCIVVEGVPAEVGHEITGRVSVPTVGIGAGPDCDGQILVGHDLLGLNPDFKPRIVKDYGHLGENLRGALTRFADEVRAGRFPDEEHSF